MTLSRRRFIVSSASAVPLGILAGSARADDIPPALANAKAQFYNFLRAMAQDSGLAPQQNVVLNSTILPFDIAADTPFYNEELFRQYADRTFSGGVEKLQADSAAFLAARFSSQYRAVMNVATAQIDQNHPEIQNSMADLREQQRKATTALTTKLNQFDQEWGAIAVSRGLKPDTLDYNMQYATWLGQVRFSDQIQSFTDDIDRINAQIDATRRRVYTTGEIAALDNLANLSQSYNIARPWTANVERSYMRQGTPLTELFLSDPRRVVPAMFDASPLVFPVGDLIAFLSGNGLRDFNTGTYSSQLDETARSWTASGGGGFLGWSFGAGGSGSSSWSRSISKMSSVDISFKNLSEYLADRSAWFNPGVLQDKQINDLVKTRPELNKLQYIAVSLILGRGTTLILKFAEAVNNSDWSKSSFSANGGVSLLGFSFGASGGSSSSSYSISASGGGTTVTIQDDEKVCRVLGVRVEPFLKPTLQPSPESVNRLMLETPELREEIKAVRQGKESYLDFQNKRVKQQMRKEKQP